MVVTWGGLRIGDLEKEVTVGNLDSLRILKIGIELLKALNAATFQKKTSFQFELLKNLKLVIIILWPTLR